MNTSEYQEIMKRLQEIEIQGAKIETKLDGNHKAFRDFETEMKVINHKIDATIYGNGQPGLTTKIKLVEDIHNKMGAHQIQDNWMFGIIITLLVFIIGAILNMGEFHG